MVPRGERGRGKKSKNWKKIQSGEERGRRKVFSSKSYALGFPGGAVVGSLPADAGDVGSSPGLGRSHMPRSNWTHEPQLLSLRIWSLCPATREAAIVRGPRTAMKSSSRSLQLEKKPARSNEDSTQTKKKKEKKKKKIQLKG